MAGPEAVSSSDSFGVQKAPPSSIEAEEALLGSALLSRDASNRLMEAIKPGDFYSPNNEKIFDFNDVLRFICICTEFCCPTI